MPGDLQNISVTATGRRLKAFEVDATHCPDLFPILAVLAAHCDGTSRIAGVGRLTQKESNRAETIYAEFRTLGRGSTSGATRCSLRAGRCMEEMSVRTTTTGLP